MPSVRPGKISRALLAFSLLSLAAGPACGGGDDPDDSTASPSVESSSTAAGTADAALPTGEPTIVLPGRSPTRVSVYRAITAAQFKPEDVSKPTLPIKDGTRIDSLENVTLAGDNRYPAVAFMLADESDIVAPFDGKIELRVTIPETGRVSAGSFSYVVINSKGEAVELWLPPSSILHFIPGQVVRRGQSIAKYVTGSLGKDGGSFEVLMFFSRSTVDLPVPVTNEVWATGTPVIFIG
jgi:hypothetical protein